MREVFFLICILALNSSAIAQNKSKKKPRPSNTIDFEDELILGEKKNPELIHLFQKKQFNFKRLIKLRKNFLPEMRKTAEDIKPRSGQK